ncbi:predicted protein [Histoplasma capsulatum var. duboisii H88]|uniref:Predicted protein n=2 Tax=Ajellomyces capsulatus (strain H88) TaxID=544711 RepID=F0UJX6_AJEC8|nr:predicted protein [Histoplasma capsulatum var. duboisii H88]
MSDRTHAPAPQIPTRSEACRIHHHSNHDVLVPGHSSPRPQRMKVNDDDEEAAVTTAAAAAEEEEDGDAIGEDEDGLEVARSTETENAFFILLRLSFLVPPFTLVAALYTLAVLLLLLLALPLRLCIPSPFFKSSLSTQTCSLLLPLLRAHQRLVAPQPRPTQSSGWNHYSIDNNNNNHNRRHRARCYRKARALGGHYDAESPHPYDAIHYQQEKPTTTTTNTTTTTTTTTSTRTPITPRPHPHPPMDGSFQSPSHSSLHSPAPSQSQSSTHRRPSLPPKTSASPCPSTTHSPLILLLILLLSPALIPSLLLAAWIAAAFWVFAMIVGNPDGTERRDDGRVAMLGVRNWWWMWLCWARRRGKKRKRVKVRERDREKRAEFG